MRILAYLPDGHSGFQYDDEWLRNDFSTSSSKIKLTMEKTWFSSIRKKPSLFLSSAYDFVSTPFRYAYEMGVNGKDDPEEKDLLDVAFYVGISLCEAKAIIAEVKPALSQEKTRSR